MVGASVADLRAAAESALLGGDAAHAAELLEQASELAADPSARTDVLCARARLATVTGSRAIVAELRTQATVLEPADPGLAARLLVEAVMLLLWDRHPDTLAVAQQAYALAADGDPLTRAQTESMLGLALLFAGDSVAGAAKLASSAELIRLGGPPQEVVHLVQQVIVGLSGIERYSQSMALCRQYVSAVRSVAGQGLLPFMLCLLSNTAYFTAEFDAMEMAANEAQRLATGQGQQPVAIFADVCLALVHAVRADADTARSSGEAALAAVQEGGVLTFLATANCALGMGALAVGDWPTAKARYRTVFDLFTRSPWASGILHWRADQIEALWRCGDRDEAQSRLMELRACLSTDGPWEHAGAARAAAMMAEDPSADTLFAEAMRWHAQSPSTFERARTELCWGESLAARGRSADAATHLQSARDEFTRLGARPWAERAELLLAEASACPDEPTPAPEGELAQAEPDGCGGPLATVRAFGPLTLIRGGVETSVGMDIAGRTLRYLVAAGGSVHVEQLIDELWPDAPADHGATRLRTVLSRTRARYGPLLVRDGSVIRWAEGVSVDVQRFAELARSALTGTRGSEAAAVAREAVRLYDSELLPLDRYSDWTVAARERLRQRYLDLLELLTDDAVDRGDLATAIGYARDVVDSAPLDEDGYLRLAGLMLDAGRAGHARGVVERAKCAATELGLVPSAALLALERRVQTAES